LPLTAIQDTFIAQSADPKVAEGGGPAQFTAPIQADIEKWGKIRKDSGANPTNSQASPP